jgi:hypothetical protein
MVNPEENNRNLVVKPITEILQGSSSKTPLKNLRIIGLTNRESDVVLFLGFVR